ncbi:hypothetical protein [Pontibacter beigongshangensis]|uniref:hypothetical protein n=1 Tax=Pontibacter beigongshangensis TaxID=2574733 RepID=UPI00165028A2|nr:hypothetical protein [Pontibacter beigongshangensis]
MRNPLLLLPLLFILLSCSQDEDVTPAINNQLQGTWIKDIIRIQYYDAAGTLDYEDIVTENKGYVYVIGVDSISVTSPYYQETLPYGIRRVDGKEYVFSPDDNSGQWEIVTLTNNKLIWQQPYHRLNYSKGGAKKTASKSLLIEEFDR